MRVLAIVLPLVISAFGLAHADPDARKTAERYFRAGAKAYAAQNFAAAATNFDEAYKALPLPEIAFSAAQAYRRLYRVDAKPQYVRRAVDLYQTYLREVKTGGRVGDAADNLSEMKRELDRLEAAGSTTSVAASTPAVTRLGVNVSALDQASVELGAVREIGDASKDTLPGLAVSIDGKRVEPFALVEVAAQEHVIAVHADGYFPVEKKTVALAGQSSLVDVELRPMPATIKVKTESGARIVADGRTTGTAPAAPLELPAGTHLIAVLRRGREPFTQALTVARGQQLVLDAPLRPTTRRRAVPWLLGGAGIFAAGAITTGAFALARDHRASELRARIEIGDRPASEATAYDDAVQSRDRLVTWTWILGGTALAAGTAGVLLFYFDTPTSDGATVGIAGRF